MTGAATGGRTDSRTESPAREHPPLGFDPALLQSIVARVGTPVYVYSANLIRAQ